jgi:hypothetical protein
VNRNDHDRLAIEDVDAKAACLTFLIKACVRLQIPPMHLIKAIDKVSAYFRWSQRRAEVLPTLRPSYGDWMKTMYLKSIRSRDALR